MSDEDVYISEVWDVVEVDGEPVRRVRQFIDGELVHQQVGDQARRATADDPR